MVSQNEADCSHKMADSKDGKPKYKGKECQAYGCSNYEGHCPGISFFRFPSVEKRFKVWKQALKRNDLEKLPQADFKHRRLCSNHFEDCMFKNPKSRKSGLNWNATPTPVSVSHGTQTRKAPKRKAPTTRVFKPAPKRRKLTQGVRLASVQHDHKYARFPDREQRERAERNRTNVILKKTVKNLKKKYKKLSKRWENRETILDLLKDVLPKESYEFVATQIRVSAAHPKGVRWTDKEKCLALSLFHQSPACYRLLKSIFRLPSVRTLQLVMASLDINTGWNETILNGLSRKAKGLKGLDRVAVLSFDEITIKEKLRYNAGHDIIEGFEDLGYERSQYVANHASVFMLRGLSGKWKQAFGYFLSSGPVPKEKLKELLMQGLEKASATGFVVKALVCDQGSNNRSVLTTLGVSEKRPFIRYGSQEVIVFYDPPHLLKNVRNNLKNSNLVVDGNLVEWQHIAKMQHYDSSPRFQYCQKVTKKHIVLEAFKEMNVKLAAQVLSHSAYVAMKCMVHAQSPPLPPEAIHTAEFCDFMDSLFNVFNSITFSDGYDLRRPLKQTTRHLKFLEEAAVKMTTIKLPSGKDLPCLEGWRISIAALLRLWKWLHTEQKAKFLLTRRLNQDCVENFFSQIRQKNGNCVNPDTLQFRSAYRAIAVDTLFLHSKSSNCQDDADSMLLQLKDLLGNKETDNPAPDPVPQPSSSSVPTRGPVHHVPESQFEDILSFMDLSTPELTNPEQHVLVYVSGYLVKKVGDKYGCVDCLETMVQSKAEAVGEEYRFLHEKTYSHLAGNSGGLVCPSAVMVSYIHELEQLYTTMFPLVCYSQCVIEKMTKKAADITCPILCDTCRSEVSLYLIGLYFRVKLHHSLRVQNQSLVQTGQKRNRKVMNLLHI